MSPTLIIILIGAVALVLGVAVGYYLRVLVALGKRRSIEIDIKQMMVGAKEEAQRITDEAKKLSEEKLAELREDLVLGLLADRAGVDQDHVGLALVVGELVLTLAKQAGDPLGVVLVHLAAVRDEVELARHVWPVNQRFTVH